MYSGKLREYYSNNNNTATSEGKIHQKKKLYDIGEMEILGKTYNKGMEKNLIKKISSKNRDVLKIIRHQVITVSRIYVNKEFQL